VIRFVLDASVALAWLVDHSPASYAIKIEQLLYAGRGQAVVPSLWELEVANGFITAERRGILTPVDTAQILTSFEAVIKQAVEIASAPISMRRAINAARGSGLTAYDAVYLELARELQLPIATLDRRLAEAAKHVGVRLVQ